MTNEPGTPNRRRAIRKVNYNEKDADEDVVRRIQLMEKNREASSASAASKMKVPKTKYQEYLNDKSTAWNFIPSLPATFRKHSRFSNVLELENAVIDVKSDILSNGASVLFKRDDHIYMVSEPPGEPYYIGRVVQFEPKAEFSHLIEEGKKYTSTFPARYFQAKMNWYYRPRDVQEKALNVSPRLLYASLHMDLCPLHSYRGKCTVLHRSTLEAPKEAELEGLTKPNTFYYEQLFDRYTLQYYDVWDTRRQLLPLAPSSMYLSTVAKLYPFVFVEEQFPLEQVIQKYVLGRKPPDEQTWDLKCAECGDWCEKNQCLRCDECHITVHLYCLDPPLERKPAKGVIWICSKCNTKVDGQHEHDQWTPIDQQLKNFNQFICLTRLKENLWFHYLGSKVVDNLIDVLSPELSLPFPIKKLRTGSKYQWIGCENDQWEPKPYEGKAGERGEDDEKLVLWKSDTSKLSELKLDDYIEECQKRFPQVLDIVPQTCNFWDMILNILMINDYNPSVALKKCSRKITRETLREPNFTQAEIAKFEEGVAKHGSELHYVFKHVITQPMAMIVRFYYHWKKTPNGRRIWGNFEGRKKNKNKSLMGSKKKTEDMNKTQRIRKPSKISRESETAVSKEWKHIDDSSFDSEKISTLKTYFKCMFCEVDYSPLWFRVTGGCDDDHIKTRMITGVNEKTSTSDKLPRKKHHDEANHHLEALCIRCARLWRRYAVKWYSPMDVIKKLNGKYSSSVRAALDLLLTDSDDTTVKVQPSLLSEKCVEWELVQDSELIIKQRLSIIGDPEKFAKMKRNCLSVHAQLNKVVRRLVEKDGYSDGRMTQLLENLVREFAAEARKKERQAKSKEERLLAMQNRSKITTQTPAKRTSGPREVGLVTSAEAHTKNGARKISKEAIAGKNTKQDLAVPSGDKVVDVFVGENRRKIGEIKVDDSFENIRLSDELFSYIFKSEHPPQNLVVQSQPKTSDGIEDCESTHINKAKGQMKASDFSAFQVTNASNAPIVTDGSFPKILEAYHKHNPFYNEWSQGKLPRINYEHLQKMTTDPNPLISNHLGRRAKSPFSIGSKTGSSSTLKKRDFCCVCHLKFAQDRDEEILCQNCGLNVHFFCYGLDAPNRSKGLRQDVPFKDYHWLCDPCSNELNPIATENYQCCLCNAHEHDDDGARLLKGRSIPDALKITATEEWSHVSCSLFNENIAYNASGKLQCVGKITKTLLRGDQQTCSVCRNNGGGLVKCTACSLWCHVTCGQDAPGYTFKFDRVQASSNGEQKRVVEIDGEVSEIRPVLVCPNHDQTQFASHLPLNYRTEQGESLQEIYCKNYKNSGSFETSPVKMKLAEMTDKSMGMLTGAINDVYSAESKNNITAEVKQCEHCKCHSSIYWYGNKCYSCYNNIADIDTGLLSDEEENEKDTDHSDRLAFLELKEEFLKDIHIDRSNSSNIATPRVKRSRTPGPLKGVKKAKSVKVEDSGSPSEITSVVVQNPRN
ncbi:LAFA_0G20956g1_1 [Lachancea sp. 'fantastica']|nr:LAFA_0G20956g1_1 [Lachancea sp. 'fantastica']